MIKFYLVFIINADIKYKYKIQIIKCKIYKKLNNCNLLSIYYYIKIEKLKTKEGEKKWKIKEIIKRNKVVF